MQAACTVRLETLVGFGHLERQVVTGEDWYWWGPARKWISSSCLRYDSPNGRLLADQGYFGITCSVGVPCEEPAPTPPPLPTPHPPSPVCTAGPPDCMTIDVSCAGSTDCGIAAPPGWAKGGPVPIQLNRKVWPKHWVVKLDVSYCRGSPGNKIHAEDACYPGPISEWTNQTLVHNCGDAECHNDGGTPFPGKHVLRLEGGHTGKWEYTAHGELGLTATAVLEVRR